VGKKKKKKISGVPQKPAGPREIGDKKKDDAPGGRGGSVRGRKGTKKSGTLQERQTFKKKTGHGAKSPGVQHKKPAALHSGGPSLKEGETNKGPRKSPNAAAKAKKKKAMESHTRSKGWFGKEGSNALGGGGRHRRRIEPKPPPGGAKGETGPARTKKRVTWGKQSEKRRGCTQGRYILVGRDPDLQGGEKKSAVPGEAKKCNGIHKGVQMRDSYDL